MKLGFILFTGLFMMLAISAKMDRDKQAVGEKVIKIDHTSGNFFITEEDVLKELNELLPENGAVIHTNDLRDLEQKLEQIPQIKESNVFVDNVGQLSINVKQRQPVYRVIRKNNKSYYVDKSNYKFPVSKKYTANVPLVTGYIADNGKNEGVLTTNLSLEISDLMTELLEDGFLKAQFGQIEVTDKGEFELIPRVGSHIIQLGNGEHIEEKLQRLKIFYHEGLKKTGWNAYKVINVKYKDQVVCTK